MPFRFRISLSKVLSSYPISGFQSDASFENPKFSERQQLQQLAVDKRIHNFKRFNSIVLWPRVYLFISFFKKNILIFIFSFVLLKRIILCISSHTIHFCCKTFKTSNFEYIPVREVESWRETALLGGLLRCFWNQFDFLCCGRLVTRNKNEGKYY